MTLPAGIAAGQCYFIKTSDFLTFNVIFSHLHRFIFVKSIIFSSNFVERRHCLPCLLGGNAPAVHVLTCCPFPFGRLNCYFPIDCPYFTDDDDDDDDEDESEEETTLDTDTAD